MDALEAIFTRCSIRKYQNRLVPKEHVDILLKAAMNAPSAVDNRDWAFIVVDDRGTLDNLSGCLNNSGKMLLEAPLAIVVCGDWSRAYRFGREYWIEDCAASSENILLAAHASGLGAVWLGVYPQTDKMKNVIKLFDLPDHIIPFSIIAAGWPDEPNTSNADGRFELDRVHYNTW
jgi:nitroreductase